MKERAFVKVKEHGTEKQKGVERLDHKKWVQMYARHFVQDGYVNWIENNLKWKKDK